MILGSSEENMLICPSTYSLVMGKYELLKSITLIFVECIMKYNESTTDIRNEHIKECIEFLLKLSGDSKVYHHLHPPGYDMKQPQDALNLKMNNDENSPVAYTAHLLVILLKKSNKKDNFNSQVNNWKELILHYMMNLAAITYLRPYFTKKLLITQIQSNESIQTPSPMIVLLALIKSFHSETESCRLLAMKVLQNLVLECNENQNVLIHLGGVGTLLNICTSDHALLSTSPIKSKACALLCHCITNGESKKYAMEAFLSYPDAFKKLMTSFTKIVLHPSFTNNALSKTKNDMEYTNYAALCSHIIHMLASMKSEECIKSMTNDTTLVNEFINAILQILPSPKINGRGIVDSKSICLPPDSPPKGSQYEIACRRSSFMIHVLKSLIQCLDACIALNLSKHPVKPAILNTQICMIFVEKMVCLLANVSHYHAFTIRNAAKCLARVTKHWEDCSKHCRKLRGMEILLELGRNGMI